MSVRPSVYLAGKITRTDWRSEIVSGLAPPAAETPHGFRWTTAERSIEQFADYVGPFATRIGNFWHHDHCEEHGSVAGTGANLCNHGESCSCWSYAGDYTVGNRVAEECAKSLRRASHVFAFVESHDDTGTIAEVGFAHALQFRDYSDVPAFIPFIEVWFRSRDLAREMWFLSAWARHNGGVAESPELAWMQSQTRDLIMYLKSKSNVTTLCESPIESRLAEAILWTRWGKSLKAQHRIGPYRADLALLDHRIVIECDGHAYHSTKEQRGHDAKRDRFLTAQGWRVVRCTGTEIHADVSKVVADIEAVVNSGTGA